MYDDEKKVLMGLRRAGGINWEEWEENGKRKIKQNGIGRWI